MGGGREPLPDVGDEFEWLCCLLQPRGELHDKSLKRRWSESIKGLALAALCPAAEESKAARTVMDCSARPGSRLGAAISFFWSALHERLREDPRFGAVPNRGAALQRLEQAFKIPRLTSEMKKATAGGEPSDQPAIRLRLKPTRGPLAELSAYICDTCWARKRGIMRTHPHMVFVPLILDEPQVLPDSAHTPLMGGAFLMKTVDAKGQSVLVIRGLNPHAELLEHVSASSFCAAFIGYAVGTAVEMHAAKVLISTNEAAQSNREPILKFFRGARGKYRIERLPANRETVFNDLEPGECLVLWQAAER